ncbi:MAG: protein kinase [Gemmatimonadetes bacterium]|nr:protein kinase [Gemmatimonadota bacterium]
MPDERTSFAAVQAAVADRYDVTGILAADGQGTRYTGRDRSLNTVVMITVLPGEAVSSQETEARFQREAAAVARLSHPHIVPVVDSGVREGLAYLVQPFVDGKTLEQHLRDHGRLSLGEAETLLRQLGSALDFAHARGVVHGNLTASHVLLDRSSGRWLLTGLATSSPTVADADADLRALAGLIMRGLTNEHPDAHADREAVMRWLRGERPELTSAVARAIAAPLAPGGEAPGTVEDWLAEIAAAGRRRPVKPWAAVAALLFAALGGWWAASRRPEAISAARPTIAVLPFFTAGEGPGIDLDSVMPPAVARQLQALPEYHIIGFPTVSAAIRRHFGNEPVSLDTLLVLARQLGATRIVTGRAMVVQNRITINLEVRDPEGGRVIAKADTVGAVDSLHGLVAGVTARAFRRSRGELLPALPRGLPAIAAYFEGTRNFRHAAYERAIEQFDRVIALDSAFAPAYLGRLLAVVQLLPTEAQIRAVMPTAATRALLDPVSQRVLSGYARVLNEGDLRGAAGVFQDLVTQYPEAVDAWFSLGELQFHFGPLIGIPLGASAKAFEEVLARDGSYASAVGHLITLALAEDDNQRARAYMRRYLEIDSTSVQAQLVGAGDTLLFRPRLAPRVLTSFGRRPAEFLEDVALLASEFGRSTAERLLGYRAIDALWQRAARGREKARAFRLLLASYLGSGRYASARELVVDARELGVPQDEIDRWVVASAITPLPDLGDAVTQAAAARRLRGTSDDPLTARWLAARWYTRWEPEEAADAVQDFRRLVRPPGEASPLEASLSDDILAWERIAAGDTAGALATWRRATQRFSIEQVPFALAGSLWPLRLSRVRFGLLVQRYREALEASETFLRISGFVDQAAWPEVLPFRAEAALAVGDTALAANTYADIVSLLAPADGEGVAIRQQAGRALQELRARAR